MLHGLIAFLIFALVVLLVAWAIIYILRLIPGLPAFALQIGTIIVGVVALLAILDRALPLLGLGGAAL